MTYLILHNNDEYGRGGRDSLYRTCDTEKELMDEIRGLYGKLENYDFYKAEKIKINISIDIGNSESQWDR